MESVLLPRFGTDPNLLSLGLSDLTARQKLESQGYNELPITEYRRVWRTLLDTLSEPMVSLLIGCGFIYLILGDRQEAILLLGFLGVIVAITFFQERKTETALEALRRLASPRALVIRDGKPTRIPGRCIVREDIMILNEGDRVSADAIVIAGANLLVDESLLTGESVPVSKVLSSGNSSDSTESIVFAGTTVVRGQGVARVIATGPRTEFGKIGKSLEQSKSPPTRLQKETRHLVRILTGVALALCALVFLVYGFYRRDWLGGLLNGLTLAMAILPNELPAVLLIFLALGAWRVSQKQVLTTKMPAIENLGATTVLCVDKTGTLTLNQMTVERLFAPSYGEFNLDVAHAQILPEAFQELVEFGILASSPSPFDPMEKALHRLGSLYRAQPSRTLRREYPLSQDLFAMSQVWENGAPMDYLVATKGAPEAIAGLCRLSPKEGADVNRSVSSMAKEGLRVLAVAKAGFTGHQFPSRQQDFDFKFLGLIGLADPVRPGVPQAIQECYRAGIRVIMITGDHAITASHISKAIGLRSPDIVISGQDLQKMSSGELDDQVKHVNCFARMVPAQKLRLIKSLQAQGEIVAMTGDGVNDAPALKSAQIGIAMGKRGTDVARESASLVLLNDDFPSIVEAIRTGRRIFDNLQNAMAYLLAVHIPIAGISVLPVLLNLPLVLMPAHIAFLHLIIEPACSLVFEAEPIATETMQRKPRSPDQPLYARTLIVPSLVQGCSVFAIVLAVFMTALYRGQGAEDARALTFTTLIFANLGLILVNRSWSRTLAEGFDVPNKALWWTITATVIILVLVLYVPFLRVLFRFSVLHPIDILISIGAGFASILWFEGWKLIRLRRSSQMGWPNQTVTP